MTPKNTKTDWSMLHYGIESLHS